MRADQEAYRTYRREKKAVEAREKLVQAVGVLIGDGRCDEAEKLALGSGDFSLATQIKDYCAR